MAPIPNRGNDDAVAAVMRPFRICCTKDRVICEERRSDWWRAWELLRPAGDWEASRMPVEAPGSRELRPLRHWQR
jgi:hypothetical protein